MTRTIAIRATSERYNEPLNRCPVRVESTGDGPDAFVGIVSGSVSVSNAIASAVIDGDPWEWVNATGYQRAADEGPNA